jgi:hypothetical protein
MKVRAHEIIARRDTEHPSVLYLSNTGKPVNEESLIGMKYCEMRPGLLDMETSEFIPDVPYGEERGRIEFGKGSFLDRTSGALRVNG